MDDCAKIKCGNCGKEIKHGSYVEIAVDGKRASRFCNTKCWDSFLKERIEEARNPEKFIRELKEKQKAYRKDMIKNVRAMEKITTDEEIIYLYEGLSNKKRAILARRLFRIYVKYADGNVKDINTLVEKGSLGEK